MGICGSGILRRKKATAETEVEKPMGDHGRSIGGLGGHGRSVRGRRRSVGGRGRSVRGKRGVTTGHQEVVEGSWDAIAKCSLPMLSQNDSEI